MNLGRGVIVPYPERSEPAATKIGQANRRIDTEPERLLRSALHRRGLRFRKDPLIRAGAVKVHPEVVFAGARFFVFVDGCFWHGCPEHLHTPKRNRDYWVPKLAANAARDRRVDAALGADGWLVLRVWEHEPTEDAAAHIEAIVRHRSVRGRDFRPPTLR